MTAVTALLNPDASDSAIEVRAADGGRRVVASGAVSSGTTTAAIAGGPTKGCNAAAGNCTGALGGGGRGTGSGGGGGDGLAADGGRRCVEVNDACDDEAESGRRLVAAAAGMADGADGPIRGDSAKGAVMLVVVAWDIETETRGGGRG